jgi:hypothetical protein
VVGVVSVVAGSSESLAPFSVVSVVVVSVDVVVPALVGVVVVVRVVDGVVGPPSAAADEIVAAATPEAANTAAMNSIAIRRLRRELI